jgi:hypothetical protein
VTSEKEFSSESGWVMMRPLVMLRRLGTARLTWFNIKEQKGFREQCLNL